MSSILEMLKEPITVSLNVQRKYLDCTSAGQKPRMISLMDVEAALYRTVAPMLNTSQQTLEHYGAWPSDLARHAQAIMFVAGFMKELGVSKPEDFYE